MRSEDFNGLRHLAAKVGDDFLAGFVLYTGNTTLPFGSKMRALPASALWQLNDEGRSADRAEAAS